MFTDLIKIGKLNLIMVKSMKQILNIDEPKIIINRIGTMYQTRTSTELEWRTFTDSLKLWFIIKWITRWSEFSMKITSLVNHEINEFFSNTKTRTTITCDHNVVSNYCSKLKGKGSHYTINNFTFLDLITSQFTLHKSIIKCIIHR